MKEKAGERAENGTMMRQSCISGRAMHFMGDRGMPALVLALS